MPRRKKAVGLEKGVNNYRKNDAKEEKSSDQILLDRIGEWKGRAENDRSSYDSRWAKNLKLIKGIWPEDEVTRSKVRNRSKIFFRKIWATNWRLLASLYNAFFRDKETFRLDGRGPEDVQPVGVLQEVVEYRKDRMMRRQHLFIKLLWSLMDILYFGVGIGKLRWVYGDNTDEPEFISYPPERVYMDLTAESPEKRKFLIFEDYMTREDMELMGYENLDEAEPVSLPSNSVRAVRFSQVGDPIQNAKSTEYPSPGRYSEGRQENVEARYVIWECFYMEKGKIKFCVTNQTKCFLKKPADNPFGDLYPDIFGTCLLEPHMLMGEGFAEPLEGPQESFNHNLNMRKDNVALALNRGTIVSRYGGVDLQSLINSRPGGITLADDVNAVKEREMQDVTRSSYQEALIDDAMSQEMSGVTPGKQGMGGEEKATTAQINYTESNAKINLFIAIVGETFMKDFYYKLSRWVSMFETDETVIRVANSNWRQKSKIPETAKTAGDINDVEDFDLDFDCIFNVGAGAVGTDMEIQQILLAMDRAITSNQNQLGLLQLMQGQQGEVKFFDTSKIMERLLPKIGFRDVDSYYFKVKPPPAPPPQGGVAPTGAEGAIAPQIGARPVPGPRNMIQEGSAGGV